MRLRGVSLSNFCSRGPSDIKNRKCFAIRSIGRSVQFVAFLPPALRLGAPRFLGSPRFDRAQQLQHSSEEPLEVFIKPDRSSFDFRNVSARLPLSIRRQTDLERCICVAVSCR
eukprot:396120_1